MDTKTLVAVIGRSDWTGDDRLQSAICADAFDGEPHEFAAMIRYHLVRHVTETDPEARALIAQRLGEDLIAQAMAWIEGQEP